MASTQPAAVGERLLRVVLPAAALGYAVLAVLRLPPSQPLLTTYGSASPTAHASGLLAGAALLSAGAWTAWQSPARRTGLLMTTAGVLWFAPDWVGWEGGPPLLRALAAAAAPFLPAVLLHLAAGLLDSRLLRQAAVAAYVLVAGLSLATALLVDPFLDPHCWRNCSDNPLLLWSTPGAAAPLETAVATVWVAAGAGAAGAAAWQLASGSRTSRRWLGPVLAGMAFTGAGEAAYATTLLRRVESPEDDLFVALYVGRAAAWLLLAVAVAALTVRQGRRRTALSRLVRALEQAPQGKSLQSSLRGLTGDGNLDVHYPVGSSGRRVTAAGLPAPPLTPSAGRVGTVLRRGETVVAELRHDPHLLSVEALQDVLGPAARLALENERLTAEQLARLHDVRASRARIVETGDAARRRLERDLHDGAQQRLLALGYLVRTARSAAPPDVAALLDAAVEEAQLALDELCRLSHGIHPAPLSASGLAVALRSLADTAAVPVELPEVTGRRFPPSIELAAYAVVRDAVGSATGPLDVRVTQAGDTLIVQVEGCVPPLPDEVADRVGALGGRAARTTTGRRAELPCA